MPFNLIKMESYIFDFDSIISAFITRLNIEEINSYLNGWRKVLNDLETETKYLVMQFHKHPERLASYLNENEIFQFPFTFFNQQQFVFEFNASVLNDEIKKHAIQPEEYSVKDFSSADERNMYQYTHYQNVSDAYLNLGPIIIAPFPDLNTTGIVIDGNHRLSAYKEHMRATIQGYQVFPYGTYHFGTPIDMGMYLFYNDLQSILIRRMNGERIDELLSTSFLMKKFKNYFL